MKQTNPLHAAVFIACLLGVAIFIYSKRVHNTSVPIPPSTVSAPVPTPQGTPPGEQGQVITINDHEWFGISCTDKSKTMKGVILTKGVRWQVRLDHDDTKVYELPMYGENKILTLPDSNLMEWQVIEGQSIRQAYVLATIEPKR